jgi:hypothetical protein
MKNRRFAWGVVFAFALALSSMPPVEAQGAAGAKDPLLFPKDNFTVETMTVRTSKGEKNWT